MPFVNPPLLGSSIFLYGSEADASEGANWGGSGFLVGVESEANSSRVHLYAVTNEHVVNGSPVPRIVAKGGNAYVCPTTQSDWEDHPGGDDIAVCPLGAVAKDDYWYVSADLLLSESDLNPEDRPYQISPGDDCLMVGRYINQDLHQLDRPVVRFGNLAMLPEVVHQKDRSFDQESFLVDMRSHVGFSGSPVFVYYEEPGWRALPPLTDPSEQVAGRDVSGLMGKTWLLGIDWGHLPVWDDVYDGDQKIGRMRVNAGMAAVLPAWKLTELLSEAGIKMGRDKAERQLAARDEGAAVLDVSEPDEFEQFEDLTRKLLQIPKEEADEKRRTEEA